MRSLVCVIAFLFLLQTPALAQCRQALILGMDVSGSVNEREYDLQRQGLAAALVSLKVKAAIFDMPAVPVHISVFEWSAADYQRVLVPWTVLRSEADLREVATKLRDEPPTKRPYSTALGQAMQFGVSKLRPKGDCWRRTLDLSGDGVTNDGPLPYALFRGDLDNITINGLVIGNGDAEGNPSATYATDQLARYFEGNVLRGPDAFVEKAIGFTDFQEAMERKLLRELSNLALGGDGLGKPRRFAKADQ